MLINFILFIWILSFDRSDLRLLITILRPIYIPIYWLSILINNLLFKDYNILNEGIEYSINENDLRKMTGVITEINTEREQNSPENYELNAKYLLNGVIISLSLYYSYNIYWSTMEHQKNLYRI